MKGTNDRLMAHATRDDKLVAEGKEGMKMGEAEVAGRARQDAEVVGLVKRWSGLHFVRGLMPLVGAVIGVYASDWM